jgi:hypothetical protein
LREALGALTNFLADPVPNAAEIAKVDSVDGQQLLDGVDADMVENIARLHTVADIGDAAASIESPGDQLDAGFGYGSAIHRLERLPTSAQHLLRIAEVLGRVAPESAVESGCQAVA